MGDAEYEVVYRTVRDRQIVGIAGIADDGGSGGNGADGGDVGSPGIEAVEVAPDGAVLLIDGVRRAFAVSRYPGLVCVDSALGPVALVPVPRFTEPGRALATGSLIAQMPGTVLRIAVAVGQSVAAGEPLLWLEAMKMQHVITSPAAGRVSELPASVGQQVDQGAVLAVITPQESQ